MMKTSVVLFLSFVVYATAQFTFRKDVQTSQIRFHLYTRNSPTDGTVIETTAFDGTITDPNFNATLPTFFFVHGWTKSPQDWTMTDVRDKIFADTNAQVNIFHADWYEPAHYFYTYAVEALPTIGGIMGDFIGKLQTKYEIPTQNINLYGVSVGGQLVGIIGHALEGKVNQIISADPAWPLFNRTDDLSLRLDDSDAKYVQVIHTNARFMSTMTPLGHVDFYPNGGGMNQPGCGADLLLICAHDRAVVLYVESLISDALVGTKCGTYEAFKAEECAQNEKLSLGGLNPDQSAYGTYFLDTNSEDPFGLN